MKKSERHTAAQHHIGERRCFPGADDEFGIRALALEFLVSHVLCVGKSLGDKVTGGRTVGLGCCGAGLEHAVSEQRV